MVALGIVWREEHLRQFFFHDMQIEMSTVLHNVRAENPPPRDPVYPVVCSSWGCLHPLLLHKMTSEGKVPQPPPPGLQM